MGMYLPVTQIEKKSFVGVLADRVYEGWRLGVGAIG
jgi:hypothetical protein